MSKSHTHHRDDQHADAGAVLTRSHTPRQGHDHGLQGHGGHGHQHGHDHEHGHGSDSRRLGWALLITGLFMLIEVAGGWWTGSLALLADAGHMLTDAAALLLAWVAARLARQPATANRTYGQHRAQVIAAFINAIALLAIVAWILWQAVDRLRSPHPVIGMPMFGIAVAGLIANLAVFYILREDHGDNLNVAAARLHVLGDLLGSLAAAGAALVIILTGWTPIDPLLSVLVALLVASSAWRLLRESTRILMEHAPESVDVDVVRNTLLSSVPGIRDVHDVHCWSLTSGRTMLTMHVSVQQDAHAGRVLSEAKRVLTERFAVSHSAVQLEHDACPDESCRL